MLDIDAAATDHDGAVPDDAAALPDDKAAVNYQMMALIACCPLIVLNLVCVVQQACNIAKHLVQCLQGALSGAGYARSKPQARQDLVHIASLLSLAATDGDAMGLARSDSFNNVLALS